MTENDSKKTENDIQVFTTFGYFYFFMLMGFSFLNMKFMTFFFKFQSASKGILPLFFILSKKIICIMIIWAFV